jgi:hypothetical protein
MKEKLKCPRDNQDYPDSTRAFCLVAGKISRLRFHSHENT